MVKRLQITLDETLLKRVDECAKEKGLNRSAFISVACDDYIRATTKGAEIRQSVDKLLEGMRLKLNGFEAEGDKIIADAQKMAEDIRKS